MNTPETQSSGTAPAVIFGRVLFVYAKDGRIRCYSGDEIRPIQQQVRADGWTHTATIDPARWIEAMANENHEPSDMLNELQFLPLPNNAMSHARSALAP